MKTKNNRIKTAAICGALAVLSLVNVCVLSFNKSQVNPILTRNVNADAEILGPYTISFSSTEFWESLRKYYKYDEIRTVCNSVTISQGTMSAEQLRNTVFNVNASVPQGTATYTIDGNATARMDYKKDRKGGFNFAVDITLPGQEWKVKTCEPCPKDDVDVLSSKCVEYDQCANVIKARIKAYRAALGV